MDHLGYGRAMSVDSAVLGGRYRLEGLIGRGGMASVWRATDTVLERTVAVKRLHARLHDDPELAERFRREGHAVARLSHPNLVRLLDQGQDGDEPFLVFELVEGRDLKTMIRRDGRIPVGETIAICTQIAHALAAAHAAGVVHRDIKSHNVLVTEDGIAKLTDFGIARIVEAEGVSLTKTGIVMGSSDYLAPEQAEGREVDARADVYSLGVVLFEALTGRLPFSGDNPVAVATKHVYEAPPDPRSLVPHIPTSIASACLRALAKRPGERFASADAFALALEGGADDTAIAVFEDPTTGRIGQVRPRRRSTSFVAGIAVLVLGGAGFGLWQAGVFDGSGGDQAGSLPLVAVLADFDPAPGDGQEKPELVPNASDGDLATAWTTEGYGTADLGGIKPGVGLRATLASPAIVTGVRISSETPGGTVQLLGAAPDVISPRPVLGQGVLPDGTGVIALATPTRVAEIVIWMTALPSAGTGDRPFRASIGEVAVLGVAKT